MNDSDRPTPFGEQSHRDTVDAEPWWVDDTGDRAATLPPNGEEQMTTCE